MQPYRGLFLRNWRSQKLPNHVLRASAQRRWASTASNTAGNAKSFFTRLKNFFYGTFIIVGLGCGYLYVTDARSGIHRWVVVPALRYMYPDAEDAHEVGNKILKALHDFGLHPRERGNADAAGDLSIEVFGHVLDNPIATSAGIDKQGDIPSALLDLGPAIVEVGGATPFPQEGNAKPRVFRIPSQNALINRYGLNSEGAEHVTMQLRQRLRQFAYSMGYGFDKEAEKRVLDGEAGVPPGSLKKGKLLAVQVAKNKSTPDHDIEAVTRDYVYCVEHLAKYADIITVNVSSPNTPGLRDLQRAEPLKHILRGVVNAAKSVDRKTKPAVMVKVSVDEDTPSQVIEISQAVWAAGADGIIVGNTTKKRPDPMPDRQPLSSKEVSLINEQGGYSGPQLFERTLALVKSYRKTLDEPLHQQQDRTVAPKVIFASGGITNGQQVLDVLNAGASVAMTYTALVYGGASTITRMKTEMRKAMKAANDKS